MDIAVFNYHRPSVITSHVKHHSLGIVIRKRMTIHTVMTRSPIRENSRFFKILEIPLINTHFPPQHISKINQPVSDVAVDFLFRDFILYRAEFTPPVILVFSIYIYIQFFAPVFR